MSKIVVVDANVAIKWILPEIYSWEALGLLQNEENQLLVPDFFFSECGNILWKRVRRGEIDLITSQRYLNEILAVNLQIYQSSQLVPLALEISVRIQQAVYSTFHVNEVQSPKQGAGSREQGGGGNTLKCTLAE